MKKKKPSTLNVLLEHQAVPFQSYGAINVKIPVFSSKVCRCSDSPRHVFTVNNSFFGLINAFIFKWHSLWVTLTLDHSNCVRGNVRWIRFIIACTKEKKKRYLITFDSKLAIWITKNLYVLSLTFVLVFVCLRNVHRWWQRNLNCFALWIRSVSGDLFTFGFVS